jgi:hypothetical protein
MVQVALSIGIQVVHVELGDHDQSPGNGGTSSQVIIPAVPDELFVCSESQLPSKDERKTL